MLCLLLYPVIASPADSFEPQAILTQNFQSDKPKSELGWFDPREKGGQFLDVSEIYHKNYPSGANQYLVHNPEIRGAAQCYRLWSLRSLHFDRVRAPRLRKVGVQ